MTTYKFTITEEMVADPKSIPVVERYRLLQCMGQLLPIDIGKRVYEIDPRVYQVENRDQLEKRL